MKVVRIAPVCAALLCTLPGVAGGMDTRSMKDSGMEIESDKDGGRRNLPFSHGHSFATLDDYLAHLRQYAGPVGQPWYRQIRPGVYERVTTQVPPGRPEVRTRAELMQQFGFTR